MMFKWKILSIVIQVLSRHSIHAICLIITGVHFNKFKIVSGTYFTAWNKEETRLLEGDNSRPRLYQLLDDGVLQVNFRRDGTYIQ